MSLVFSHICICYTAPRCFLCLLLALSLPLLSPDAWQETLRERLHAKRRRGVHPRQNKNSLFSPKFPLTAPSACGGGRASLRRIGRRGVAFPVSYDIPAAVCLQLRDTCVVVRRSVTSYAATGAVRFGRLRLGRVCTCAPGIGRLFPLFFCRRADLGEDMVHLALSPRRQTERGAWESWYPGCRLRRLVRRASLYSTEAWRCTDMLLRPGVWQRFCPAPESAGGARTNLAWRAGFLRHVSRS